MSASSIEVVYYVAASLDGFIATPDGGTDWLAPFEDGSEDYGYADFFASVDSIVMGRKTCEKSLTFGEWPYPGKPAWILSRQPIATAEPGVTVTAAGPAAVVREMDRRGLKRSWLVGGGVMATAFRAEGLLTEYVVSTVPVLPGSGIPLFASGGPRQSLRLVASRTYGNGLVQTVYQPAGH